MTKLSRTLSAMIAILTTITGVSAASYQLLPIEPDQTINKTSRGYLGANINMNFPHASGANTDKQTGHYGFGMHGGTLFYMNHHHLLGAEVNVNTSAPTVFSKSDRQLIRASLQDINLLGKYQYQLTDHVSLGLSGGIGFVYGWVSNSEVGFYSRFEPVLGSDLSWHLSDQVAVNLSYQHSFGVAAKKAYQFRQGAPSIDRISLGASYVF